MTKDEEFKIRFVWQKFYEHGEKPGKYLAYFTKKRAESQTITALCSTLGGRLYILMGQGPLYNSIHLIDDETSLSKYTLRNLLFIKNFRTIWLCCDNPVTLNTTKAWRSMRRLEGRSKLTIQISNLGYLTMALDSGVSLAVTY